MPAMPLDVPAIIQDQAAQSGVDPNLALAIIQYGERSGQNAVSPKGAIGYGQLMPATARSLGVDPNDPEQNLRGSVRYMRQLQDQFGNDPRLIAAGYNAGPGAVAKAGGVPNYPETQAYVQRVTDALPSKQFDDSDFDTKSGATQTQNSSAIAPQFADSDFVAAPKVQPASGSIKQMSFGDQLEREAGLTGRDVLEGGSKLLGIVGDPLNYLSNKFLGTNLGNVSDTGGQLADKLGLPTPQGALETGVNNAAQALVGTGGQAAAARGLTGLAANPIMAGFLKQLSANTAGQATGAITGSAAAQAAHAGGQAFGLNPYAQGALDFTAGLAGGAIGGSGPSRITNGITDASTAGTLAAAKSAGVPVQLSDVNPSWAGAMRLAGKLPFGLGTMLGGNKSATQVAGVRSALENAAEQYRPNGLDPTAGAQGTDRFLANDLRSVASQRQVQNDALYSKVDQIASNANLPAAELPATSAKAQELWDRFPDALKGLELDSKTARILRTLKPGAPEEAPPQTVQVGGKTMVWDDLSPQLKAQLQAAGVAPEAPTAAKPLTFSDLNDLRTGLGDALGQAKQAALSGAQSRTKVGLLSQMYRSVTDDIDGYLNRNDVPPELKQATGEAQNYFKQNVLPLRDDARINQVLASQPGTDGVDEAAQGLHNYIFSANKGETAQKYLGMLSPEGQRAAAYQSIKSATDSALNTATEEGLKSATGISKLAPSPSLNAIASANPGMSQDIARLQALMRLGRTAATNQASKGVLTGFQAKDIGMLYAIQHAADALEHRGFSPGAAYAVGGGVPLAAGNIVSLLNSRSPAFLRNYLLSNPGALSTRALPGAEAAYMQEPK